jgi:hypothetical protein
MKFPLVRSLLATVLLTASLAQAADENSVKGLESFLDAPAVEERQEDALRRPLRSRPQVGCSTPMAT